MSETGPKVDILLNVSDILLRLRNGYVSFPFPLFLDFWGLEKSAEENKSVAEAST